MTEKELEGYNEVKQRIHQLEEEICALFDAMGKRISPMERVIHVISRTMQRDYPHNCEIELTLEDVRVLQDIRQRELKGLRLIIQEDKD